MIEWVKCRECGEDWSKLRNGICFDCEKKHEVKKPQEPFKFKEPFKKDFKEAQSGEEPPY